MTEIVRMSAVNDDYCTQALQAALELSMLNISGTTSRPSVGDLVGDPEFQESKSQNVTECVVVPSSEHVAEIVGRQGCKIKALRAKTNTYIKTPVRGEEPVFSISGRPEHVTSAKREILDLVGHLSEVRASRRGAEDKVVTIHVRVPYHVVGLIVGPKGATVKRIQQVTQTYIVTPLRDKEPYFEVKGQPANVERARKEIERYIALRTNIESFDLLEESGNLGSIEDISTHFHKSLCQDPQSADMSSLLPSPVFQFPGIGEVSRSLSNGQDGYSVPNGSSKFSSVFRFPNAASVTGTSNGSILTRDGGSVDTHSVGGSTLGGEPQKFLSKPVCRPPTVFQGMRFTPPNTSYQPMSALLTPENAFAQGSMKNGPQPISPTGSFESSCSDGITSVSPNLSPHPRLYIQNAVAAPVTCYICNANEDMAALIPCRHSNFCQSCAHYVACAHGSCPLCHTQVTNVMHL